MMMQGGQQPNGAPAAMTLPFGMGAMPGMQPPQAPDGGKK